MVKPDRGRIRLGGAARAHRHAAATAGAPVGRDVQRFGSGDGPGRAVVPAQRTGDRRCPALEHRQGTTATRAASCAGILQRGIGSAGGRKARQKLRNPPAVLQPKLGHRSRERE